MASSLIECCSPPAKSLPQSLASEPKSLPPAPISAFAATENSMSIEEKLVAAPGTFSKAEWKSQSAVSVVRLLLQLDDASLVEIFKEMMRERPHLSVFRPGNGIIAGASSEHKDPERIDQSVQVSDGEIIQPAQHDHTAPVQEPAGNAEDIFDTQFDFDSCKKPNHPTVQFTAPVVYANEGMGVCVEVTRVGPQDLIDGADEKTVVYWKTEDGTAIAGKKYVASSGKVEFGPSVTFQEIRVELISNEAWDPTLDFYIVLQEEGVQNAELHRYHSRCRIKLIDDDKFPSNRFAKELVSGRVDKIPITRLVNDYVKIHMRYADMRRGIKKALATDVIENLNFIFFLVLKVWMINHLLMPGSRDERNDEKDNNADENYRTAALICIACGYLVPYFFLHILAVKRTGWRLEGAPRKLLQGSLVRTYMAYTAAGRKEVDHGELILTLYKEIPDVVQFVYCGIFPIIKNSTLLIMLLLYQILGTRALGLRIGEPMYMGINIGISFAFPVLACLVVKARYAIMDQSMMEYKMSEMACSDHTIDMLNNYSLLADYRIRAAVAVQFVGKIDAFNMKSRLHNAREVNNLFMIRIMTILFCSAWIFFGGLLVNAGTISMGTFLAEWDIIDKIGGCWEDIFETLLKMQTYSTELKHVVRIMNLPVEDNTEKAYMSFCAGKGREIADYVERNPDPERITVDELPIRMFQFTYLYEEMSGIINISLELHQGMLHVITGRRDTGKSTLLKLLGGRILPKIQEGDKGYIYTPQHLRTLHVSANPFFFTGTLYENLTYGVHKGDKDANLDRVMNICKSMNILPKTLAQVSSKSDAEVRPWNDELSASDRHILNMVRGLVANPEVLCIHKPTLGLGPKTMHIVLKALQRFVRYRGLEQDAERILFRRPRTCIVTSSSPHDLEYADKVHHPFDDAASSSDGKVIRAKSTASSD